jgi:hypothetical protein
LPEPPASARGLQAGRRRPSSAAGAGQRRPVSAPSARAQQAGDIENPHDKSNNNNNNNNASTSDIGNSAGRADDRGEHGGAAVSAAAAGYASRPPVPSGRGVVDRMHPAILHALHRSLKVEKALRREAAMHNWALLLRSAVAAEVQRQIVRSAREAAANMPPIDPDSEVCALVLGFFCCRFFFGFFLAHIP